jgi:hypothetical protein
MELNQAITSMEPEHMQVQAVQPGLDFAFRTREPVRPGGFVFTVPSTALTKSLDK